MRRCSKPFGAGSSPAGVTRMLFIGLKEFQELNSRGSLEFLYEYYVYDRADCVYLRHIVYRLLP